MLGQCSSTVYEADPMLDQHVFNALRLVTIQDWYVEGFLWSHGLTTPNTAPIEIHVSCLNSMGQFHLFSTISTSSDTYHDKT